MIKFGKFSLSPWIFLSTFVFIIIEQLQQFLIAELFIFLHEMAHCIIALVFGAEVVIINIQAIGASAGLYAPNMTKLKRLAVMLAGPILNLFMFLIFMFLARNHPENQSFGEIATINIGLLIFNLLPVKPLDGYNIISIIFDKRIKLK